MSQKTIVEHYLGKFTFNNKGWKKYSVVEYLNESTVLSTSVKFVEI